MAGASEQHTVSPSPAQPSPAQPGRGPLSGAVLRNQCSGPAPADRHPGVLASGRAARHPGAHDRGPTPDQALRRPDECRRRVLQLPDRAGHRLPGPQRCRQVHHDADDLRVDPTLGRWVDRRRHRLPRPAGARPEDRRPARRIRPARRPDGTGDPVAVRPGARPARGPCRADARAGRSRRSGRRPPGRRVQPGHAPAPRYRARAARGPVGPGPRRARQRVGPGGHRLDAPAAGRLHCPRGQLCCCPATCCTRSRRSPTSW